jgi:YjbE family integral membrane protein
MRGDVTVLASLEVFLIDLLLSGDNAVVIALVCRALPPRQMRQALLVGTAAAILLRLYLTSVVAYLLEIPCLRLVGAVALVVIAIKLVVVEDKGKRRQRQGSSASQPGSPDLRSAITLIILADLVMSLDNVVALAAAAKGDILILAVGLVLSIPLLMFGSVFVGALLGRYPVLIKAGGALLGWIAGDIGIADPLVADWVNQQAPALAAAMPVVGAVFVLLESRIVERDRERATALLPATAATDGTSVPPATSPPGDGHPPTMPTGRLIGRRLTRRATRQPVPPSPASAPLDLDDAPAAGALVLVVDDNPVDQGATGRALRRLGCTVETANDGRQALERLAHRPYDLLLTDCHMPGIDGFQLATQIRRQEQASGRHLPIIGVIPFVPADALGQRCLDAGMDGCVHKPVAIDRLQAALADWLPTTAGPCRDPSTLSEG